MLRKLCTKQLRPLFTTAPKPALLGAARSVPQQAYKYNHDEQPWHTSTTRSTLMPHCQPRVQSTCHSYHPDITHAQSRFQSADIECQLMALLLLLLPPCYPPSNSGHSVHTASPVKGGGDTVDPADQSKTANLARSDWGCQLNDFMKISSTCTNNNKNNSKHAASMQQQSQHGGKSPTLNE